MDAPFPHFPLVDPWRGLPIHDLGRWGTLSGFPRQAIAYAFLPSYAFGLVYVLDSKARSALDRLRPVLKVQSTSETLAINISSMPARPALVAMTAGLAFFVFARLFTREITGDPVLAGTTDLTRWIRFAEGLMLWPLVGIAFYHATRQLRMIDSILLHHVKIDLFDQSSLYGLTGVTAYTAVGYALGVSVALYSLPSLPRDAFSLALALALFGASALVLVAPLYRLHLALVNEKAARMGANSRKLDALFRQIHTDTDAASFTHIDQLHKAIEAIRWERDIILSSRTWPWTPGSIRAVLVALLLPTLVWLVQQILESTLL